MKIVALLVAAAVATASGCANAQPAISDRAGLLAALEKAKGGETITLEPGAYGELSINNRQFTRPVVIQSRDPARPAQFISAWISHANNVTLRGLDIGRGLKPGEPEFTQINSVGDSQAIRFENVAFHGSRDKDASNDGWGLYVIRVRGLTVTGGSFEEFHRAYIIENSQDIEISHNAFERIRSDGGDFTAVQNVVIRGNRYTNFTPKKGDHADAIQFWTNGQTIASSNILIEDNVVTQGEGVGPQGIFIADEVGTLPYRNLVIRNNLIYTDDEWEAILVAGAADVEISNNTVLSTPGSGKGAWIRVEKNGQVVARNNVMVRWVPGANERLTSEGNVVLMDNWGRAKKMPNFKAGRGGQPADFVLPNVGYRVPTP